MSIPCKILPRTCARRFIQRPALRTKRGPSPVACLSRDLGRYSEQVALKIDHVAAHTGNWRTLIAYLGEISVQEIAAGKVDGVIVGHWEDARVFTALANARIPVVTTPYFQENSAFAQVIPDDYAVGVLAAEYLLAKGFRVFAYYGMDAQRYPGLGSKRRRAGYLDTLVRQNIQCHIFDNSVPDWWKFQDQRQQAALRKWIRKLPKPAAALRLHGPFCL